jgi:membrane protein implicated in regulation of membrane protease activity
MWIWLLVAVVAAIGEMLTTDLFLASVAAAAVLAALVSGVAGGVFQVLIFAIASLIGIFVLRPLIKHSLGIDSTTTIVGPVNQTYIVGRRGIVTQEVDTAGGQIRIGQGEFWSARSYITNGKLPVGAPVEVVLVDGLTALVAPAESPALESDTAPEATGPLNSDTATEAASKKGTSV